MSGFYLMHRGWQDHPVFGREEFSRRDAWVWLIDKAAYKATRVRAGAQIIDINRGQLCFSLRFMAKAWGWDDPKVRRYLKALQNQRMIVCVADAGQTVITICNYDEYQVGERVTDAGGDAEPTQKRRSSDAKKNEGNEVREKEPNGSSSQTRASALAALRAEFDAVWKQYPRRVDKDSAFKAYARARKSGAPADEIMRGVMRYGQECADREPRFIKHFATFLNAGSWTNEPEPCTPDRTAAEHRSPRHDGSATGRGLPRDDVRAAILRGLDLDLDAGGSCAGRCDPAAPGGDRGGGAAP